MGKWRGLQRDPNILRSKANSETSPMYLVLALVGKFCLCCRESFVCLIGRFYLPVSRESFVYLFCWEVLSLVFPCVYKFYCKHGAETETGQTDISDVSAATTATATFIARAQNLSLTTGFKSLGFQICLGVYDIKVVLCHFILLESWS